MYSIKRTPLAAALLLALNSPFYSATASAAPGIPTFKNEFQVNSYTSLNQKSPSIASDTNGDYVVVWQSDNEDGSSTGIFAQRYHADGTANGGEFQVNTYTAGNQSAPSVAMDAAGDFVVAWQSQGQDDPADSASYGVYAQRFNADGTKAGNEFPVNTYYITGTQARPRVAMDSTGDFVIAWQSKGQEDPVKEPSYYGVYAQRYDSAGNPDTTHGEILVNSSYTTNNQLNPSVAMDAAGDFVVAWQSAGEDGSFGGIYAQRYDVSGKPVADPDTGKDEFRVNTTTADQQILPSVAMDAAGDFVIAWQSYGQDLAKTYGIYAQRYDAAGAADTTYGEFQVNTYTTSNQSNASVAMDKNGNFAIAWQSFGQDTGGSGSNYGVEARDYNADGSSNGTEFLVNTYTKSNQNSPGIAMDTYGNFVIAWQSQGQDDTADQASYGIYAQRYAKNVDLSLVVNADTNPVTAGNNFVYSLIVSNYSTSNYATDINLSEPLPTGLTYVKDDAKLSGWTCGQNATTINCNLPNMAPGASSTINVTVTADTAGTLNNTVTVSSAQTDSNPADNTSTVTTTVNPATTSSGGGGGSLGIFTLLFAIPLWLRRRWLR